MKDNDDDGKRSAGCSSRGMSGYTPPEKRQQTRRDWFSSSSSTFSSSSPIATTNESSLFGALDAIDNTAREAQEVLEEAPTANNMCLAMIELVSIQRQIYNFRELLYIDIESGGELNNSSSATTAVDLLLPLATDDHENVSSSATTVGYNVQPLATDDHARDEVMGQFNMKFSPIRSSSTTLGVVPILEDQPDENDVTGGTRMSPRTHNVIIHDEDYERLSPGQFLNDTLIDFWICLQQRFTGD
jgi:hypothetical protein